MNLSEYDEALPCLEQSLAIRRAIGDRSGEGTTLNNMATTAHARGDCATALDYLEQSLAISRDNGRLLLTEKGRFLSNQVFYRFV